MVPPFVFHPQFLRNDETLLDDTADIPLLCAMENNIDLPEGRAVWSPASVSNSADSLDETLPQIGAEDWFHRYRLYPLFLKLPDNLGEFEPGFAGRYQKGRNDGPVLGIVVGIFDERWLLRYRRWF